MKPTVPVALWIVSALALFANPAVAQNQNDSRIPYTLTGQVFDLARVDNTIYAAGPTTLAAARAVDIVERFITFDPATGLPIALEMDVPEDGNVSSAVDDGAGGWFVGGNFSRVGSTNQFALAHVTTNGIDTSFLPALNGNVNAIVKQGTTLYVAGGFTTVNGQARGGGAAFNLTTGALLPWNPQLDTLPGTRAANALALSGSTMFIGGTFTTASAQPRPAFAAVDAATGALAIAPTVTLNAGATVFSFALSGNTLYIGGNFTAIGASSRTNLGAIDATTGAVLAFQSNTNGNVRTLLLDGAALYVGGGFQQLGGQSRLNIGRVDAATGTPDAFAPDANAVVSALVRSGTTLYVGGGFTVIGGQPRAGLAALSTATGAPSALSLGLGGGAVNTLVLSSAGLGIGGNFSHVAAVSRPGVAAIDIATNELLPLFVNVDGNVRGITAVGNTLYLAGTFTRVNGQSRLNFAAVDRHSGAVLQWNPNASGNIGGVNGGRSVVVLGTSAFIGGFFTAVNGQPRAGFAQVDATTGAVLPFTADTVGGGINRLVVAGQTLYAGGNFTTIGGQPRAHLAAYDVSGTTPALQPLTVALAAVTTPVINSLRVVGNTLYFVGIFNSVNGQSRSNSAALTLPGGTLTAFHPTVNSQLFDIDVLGSTTYLAGAFTSVNGAVRVNYAAVDAATGLVTQPFAPENTPGTGNRVAAYPEGLVAGGNVLEDNLEFFPAVGVAGVPGRPTSPTAFVFPQGVYVVWSKPAIGGDVTGYQLEVGSGPGLSNIATIPVAGSSPEFGYQGVVPDGLYYTRVRAVGPAGIGAASLESAFRVGGGCFVNTFTPTPVATVAGSGVTIAWPDPLLSVAGLSYTLSASTVSGTTNIGTFPVGTARQFVAQAPPGAYFVRLAGEGPCGIPAPSPELLVSVGGVVPLDAPVVTAQVTAGVVTINWTAVAGATGYRLDAGYGPLSASVAQLPVAGTSLVTPAPPATYYVRVYALGGPTGTSHSSNEVVVIVP